MRRIALLLVAPAVVVSTLAAESCARAPGRVLLSYDFNGRDGLISNEYATYNPRRPGVRRSRVWEVTSGSLLRRAGRGWTGPVDDTPADRLSRQATHSAVFRLVTRRRFAGNVAVSFTLTNAGFAATSGTPAHPWDGVHVILRWQSQRETYFLSVNRRDGSAVIKRKLPGGRVNGGFYRQIGPAVRFPVKLRQPQRVRATVRDLPAAPRSVELTLSVDGRRLLRVTDDGSGGHAIRHAGRVGLRADNDGLYLDDFSVRRL